MSTDSKSERTSLVSFAAPNATSDPPPPCPLCQSKPPAVTPVVYAARLHDRRYWECPVVKPATADATASTAGSSGGGGGGGGGCGMVYMDPKYRLDAKSEKSRYDLHENSPNDAGYVKFLNRLLDPLVPYLPAGARGLDYGCGPGPTISVLLAKRGFTVSNYDPYYFPDDTKQQPSILAPNTYDFVTCTETAEHFFDPASEFARINSMLKSSSDTYIGLMTEPITSTTKFATWHYIRDPTHVVFYRAPETVDWLAARYGWRVLYVKKNVMIFMKPAATDSKSVSATAAASTPGAADHNARGTKNKHSDDASTVAGNESATTPTTAAAAATAQKKQKTDVPSAPAAATAATTKSA